MVLLFEKLFHEDAKFLEGKKTFAHSVFDANVEESILLIIHFGAFYTAATVFGVLADLEPELVLGFLRPDILLAEV